MSTRKGLTQQINRSSIKGTMNKPTAFEGDILTVDQVAELLHLTPDTIYGKVERDEIPGAFRLGEGNRAPLRFSKKVLLEWIDKEATRP